MSATVSEILKRPYHFTVIREEEDGSWFGRVLEFPGCFSAGDTAEEALRNLFEVAEAWVDACLHQPHAISIPDPMPPFKWQPKANANPEKPSP